MTDDEFKRDPVLGFSRRLKCRKCGQYDDLTYLWEGEGGGFICRNCASDYVNFQRNSGDVFHLPLRHHLTANTKSAGRAPLLATELPGDTEDIKAFY